MRPLITIAILLLAGCGGRGDPESEPGPVACAGQQVVIVTNDWNGAVDVLAHTASATPTELGTVPAGDRAEFLLPGGVGSVSAKPSGLGDPSRNPTTLRQRVRYRFVCRGA